MGKRYHGTCKLPTCHVELKFGRLFCSRPCTNTWRRSAEGKAEQKKHRAALAKDHTPFEAYVIGTKNYKQREDAPHALRTPPP